MAPKRKAKAAAAKAAASKPASTTAPRKPAASKSRAKAAPAKETKETSKASTSRKRVAAKELEPVVEEPVAEPAPAKEAPAPKRRRVQAAPAAPPAPKPVNADRPALELFCFGTNSFGALGLGDPEQADDPDTMTQIPRPKQPVSADLRFVEVACGGMHTVGLTVEGDILTWGVNDEGALGRKTSGTCWEKEPDSHKDDSFVLGQAHLPNKLKATHIAAGDGMTFAIGTDGVLYGCGHFKDEVGALSGFTPESKIQGLFVPVWKPESTRDRIKKLKCGARHAAFLTNKGEVYTWGAGSQGQLGRVKHYHQDTEHQPTATDLFKPTPVRLSHVLGNSPVVDIDCGAYSTFAIAKDGSVAAWGLNNSGQLGIPKENNDDNIKWEPEYVENLEDIAQIKGGEQHTLALTKKGTLLSFGAATYGMLGRSDVNTNTANDLHPEPKPVDGLDGLKVTSIAAGTNVSACATADGDAYFWGSNTNLQLAKGTDEEDEIVPKKMGRVKVFGYRKIHHVCFGGQHGALLADSQVEKTPEAGAAPAAAAPAPAAAAPAAAAEPQTAAEPQQPAGTAEAEPKLAAAANAVGKSNAGPSTAAADADGDGDAKMDGADDKDAAEDKDYAQDKDKAVEKQDS